MMTRTATCSEAVYAHDIRYRLSRFVVTTHFAVRLVLRFWTPRHPRAHLVRVSTAPSTRHKQLHRSGPRQYRGAWMLNYKVVVSLTTISIHLILSLWALSTDVYIWHICDRESIQENSLPG